MENRILRYRCLSEENRETGINSGADEPLYSETNPRDATARSMGGKVWEEDDTRARRPAFNMNRVLDIWPVQFKQIVIPLGYGPGVFLFTRVSPESVMGDFRTNDVDGADRE